ncbi:MAG TPA: hypothetical protein VF804_13090, partial [Holophagaceae bacterium]
VLLAALVFGGLAVRERIRAGEQMAYAQRFAQEAERIEALARYLRLQPARDLSPDQADLRSRVASLQAEVRAAGSLAEAPGAYALGRAHLALDEPAGARQELERAWSLGFRTPEAAHALGRALAALYQVEVGKAYGLPDPQMRQRRIEELDRTLREPAATWLRQGAAATLEPPAYREGLLALMQGDARRAVDLAQQAQRQAPWFYESLRLEAEAQIAEAHGLQDPRLADSLLGRAGGLLAQAEARAPCDVDLLRLEMRQRQEAVARGWQTGTDPEKPVAAQITVADRWLTLEPTSAQAIAWRARARAEEARFLTFRETDPAAWLTQAKADAGEAIRRDPTEVEAFTAQASVLRTEGYRLLSQGKDASERLMSAVTTADQGLRLDPGHIVLQNIRNSALIAWIDQARLRGNFDRAAASPYLQEAIEVARAHPEEAYFQANLGGLAQAMARAEVAAGLDPSSDVETAVEAYESCLKSQPNHVAFHRGVLIALAARAKALATAGRDAEPVVEKARLAFRRAQEARVPLATLAPYLMDALLAEATLAVRQNRDPEPFLAEAGRLPMKGGLDAEDPVGTGTIQLRYISFRLRYGRKPQAPESRQVGEALTRSLVRFGSQDPDVWMALAQFQEACGDPAAAARSQTRGRALNPHWQDF